MEKLQFFFSSWDLWRNAVCAGVVLGALCGYLGVYVILHRMVFVSAALSQVSSLGVMFTLFLVQLGFQLPYLTKESAPLVGAALFAMTFSLFISNKSKRSGSNRSLTAESFIGAVYLLSMAILLILGDRLNQGAHDISNILFGNAVTVDSFSLSILLLVSLPLLILHIWFRKEILFISYDSSTALTMKLPVNALRIFLMLSLGVAISVGTRTLGALPIFTFSVIPPMAALQWGTLRYGFWLAAIFGACSAFGGYLCSFLFSLPTGACISLTAGIILFLVKGISFLRNAPIDFRIKKGIQK